MSLIDLILRRVKEAPLLNNEVDTNFENLGTGVDQASCDWAGVSEPPVILPLMTWADTGNMLLKRRNAANTAWVVEGILFKQSLPQFDSGDILLTNQGDIWVTGEIGRAP